MRRVPYRLPRVIETAKAGGTIYVVEGEKDVHAIEAAGAVATCNPMGAGKWRDEYSAALAGAHVIIVADDDEPGRKHAAAVHAALLATAASVGVVLPAQGNDASDHLRAGKRLRSSGRWRSSSRRPAGGPFIDWSSSGIATTTGPSGSTKTSSRGVAPTRSTPFTRSARAC